MVEGWAGDETGARDAGEGSMSIPGNVCRVYRNVTLVNEMIICCTLLKNYTVIWRRCTWPYLNTNVHLQGDITLEMKGGLCIHVHSYARIHVSRLRWCVFSV